jgi:hypothetical protein
MEALSIPLSKGKIVLIVIGSFAFVAVCAALLVNAGQIPRMNSIFIKAVVAFGIPFFGFCGVFGLRKLFDSKPGLIIDSEGIVDNSSAIAAGRIPWDEITGIRISEVAGQRLLTILVAAPESYSRGQGKVRAWLNSVNRRMTGSPINISTNALKISLDALAGHLTTAFAT